MKILIAANNDVGLYKFRKELIKELLHRGNEVYICLPKGDLVLPLQELGCHFVHTEIDRRGITLAKDFKLAVFYYKLLRKVKPDLVITYTIKPNIYCGVASRMTKTDYVVNITGLGTAFQKEGILRKLIIIMYRSACKKAKRVFFENYGNYEVLLSHNIVRKEQSVILPGAGVNLQEYPFTEYPSTSEGYHFLFIGRVMKEKGIEELFEAAKRIKKQRKDVFFDIVGPLEDNYQYMIEQLEKEDIILYHGYQEDVKPFIEKAHCFVLPSYHEGMANTLLESASMGRPLITSRIHGCMEAVEEGENGFLISIKSADELYDCINKFLELSDKEKEMFGYKSRQRVEKIFDKKDVVNRTIENF